VSFTTGSSGVKGHDPDMAYKFDLERDFEREPFRNAFKDEIISFVLGEDAEDQLLILMTVKLIYKEKGIYHIHFGIEEIDVADNNCSSGMDYSIEFSKRYVPKSVRSVVLDTVIDALSCMVDKVNPKKVTMQSFYKILPEKALKKYRKISSYMAERGYGIKEYFPDGNCGVRYWLYERLPPGG
jgi:hypothetical protein